MMFVPADDGRWVNEDFARLAEIINDYDYWLELRWIPPDKRTRDDKKPYMIVDTRTNIPVLFASELDTPQQILAWLLEADNADGSPLDRIELHNKAIELFEMKKRQEEMEEAMDYAKFLFQSPLNTIKANGKKYNHERRIIGSAEGRVIL